MSVRDDLPRFAGTRQFVHEAGPLCAVALLASWLGLIGMLGLAMADAVRQGEPVVVGFLLYGGFVMVLTFPAGVLWAELMGDAKAHYEQLEGGGDG